MNRFVPSFSAVPLALLVSFTAFAQPQVPPPLPGTPPPADTGPAPAPVPDVPPPAAEPFEGIAVTRGGLTADETARRALAASSSVQQKQADVAAANAKIRQTTIQFVPKLTLRASYTRLSPVSADLGSGALVGAQNPGLLTTGPCPGGMGNCVLDANGVPVGAASFAIQQLENNYAVSAALSIPLSDYILRVTDAAASASAARDAARLALQAERLKVASDARVLYYNWLRAMLQVRNAEKALEQSRARLEDARAAFEIGTVTRADLLRLEALVASTELAVQRSQALRDLGNAQLAIVMEDNETLEYLPGQGVDAVAVTAASQTATRQLIARALARRLELKALEATKRSLRRGASAARAGSLPRLDAVGDFTYANPNQRFFPPQQEWNATWSAGLVASWTIGDTFLNDAVGDELEANARGVEAQHRGMKAAITGEVVSAHLDVSTALSALKTSETGLRAAEEAYRVTTDLFRAGRATTTDLIEAESELLAARLAATDALIDLNIAALRLRHATGADIVAAR